MLVAAVQYAPKFKDVVGNRSAMVSLVREAVQRGAKLVVLPELCTTGYSFMSVEDAQPYAEDLMQSGGTLSVMENLAGQFGVAIAWGVMEKDHGTGKLYNSQVLTLSDRTFVSYRKVNRFANDFIWAEEGRGSPPITEFMGKKIGLLICRDVRDKAPAWSDFYEKGDADIVAFSANWGAGGFPSVNWIRFVKENETFLVVSNRYGKEANNDFGEGGVCIIEPSGKVHCEGLVWDQPCIVYANI
jgi:predicted amidohydrolase